jgi:predicted dehydrogenase
MHRKHTRCRNRRAFLRRVAGAVVAPQVISTAALGGGARPPASERIATGFVGLGWKGFEGCWGSLMQAFIAYPECQVVAVCDVDRRYCQRAKALVDETYGNQDCASYHDFRELVTRPDIDAVVIATPDHWHAVQTIWACRHGKDVYCEKPLALTIREARAMVEAARRYGRVVQTGSQSRSNAGLRYACRLVREGRIGEVREVQVSCGGPSVPCALPGEPVPDYLDWNLWLGPAPWRPFSARIHPRAFRAWRDYSGGGMTDWGAHHFDLAQWGLGKDETGPTEIIPPDGKDHRWLTFRYADGSTMYHSSLDISKGVTFVGSEGRVSVTGVVGVTSIEPESLHRDYSHSVFTADDLYANKGHYEDFLDCVRTRRRPSADVAIGCRTVTACHLGNIAYELKRPLQWDPDGEVFVGDAAPNRFLDRTRREPWSI